VSDAWVKFCGCTSSADVALAADAGADAFGMIFAPSPRRIAFEAAEEIARHMPASIQPVGVFVNPSQTEVEMVRELFPTAFLQFSGDETPEFVERYGERAIKAIHIDDRSALIRERCERFPAAFVLFDARQDGMAGGTGLTFNWDAVVPIAAERRVVIAGGLSPANVAECIRRAHPFGVDVRTGIETDGRKDEAKMRAFVRAVRGAR
jgi:phosphoribosylanthranilate isomerase